MHLQQHRSLLPSQPARAPPAWTLVASSLTSAARFSSTSTSSSPPSSKPPHKRSSTAAPASSSPAQRPPVICFTRQQPLPPLPRQSAAFRSGLLLAFCIWAGAALFAIHYGKQNSNVTQTVMHRVQRSPAARSLLGDNIRFTYPFPWVSGAISKRKGKIDIAFHVTGSRASGIVHYTSIKLGPAFSWLEEKCLLTVGDEAVPID
ncbi:inner membrane protein [Schizosaccharomyces japonicus yFS275]|uniref:Inner membrane protein n=1 Tax=Schizosaccharomyces japonicus (strain yFS275 / FY16936) TaxID=402676 RepID=B6K796_SCHJY|nr:inner membrane protein [Schizosaccharomyces japonicus yFS275]EEB09400.1 inner membrane protein [Schizosaccharomyces japonicus yFS275]